MPNASTPYGTTQPYIPIIAQAQLGRMAGTVIAFPSGAALSAAVVAERANVGANAALWSDGQPMLVDGEFLATGAVRSWRVAQQDARQAMLRPGLWVVLAGDDNVVLATTGVPSNGTGTDGDAAVDWPGNAYYTKAAGAWAYAGALIQTGIPIPADNDASGVVIASANNAGSVSGDVTIFTGVGGSGHYSGRVHLYGATQGTQGGATLSLGGGGAGAAGTSWFAGNDSAGGGGSLQLGSGGGSTFGGDVDITAGPGTGANSDGGTVRMEGGDGHGTGGAVEVKGGATASGTITGAHVFLFGADAHDGGTLQLWGGNSGTRDGGHVDIAAGSGPGVDGSVLISVASGGNGFIDLNGPLKLGGTDIIKANGTQAVTWATNLGPGNAALSIKGWAKIVNELGTAFYLPLFGI